MRNYIMLCLLLVLVACGSRKRAMEETENNTDIVADNKTVIDVGLKNDIVAKSESETSATSESKEQGVEVGPGGKAVIEEFDAAGNTTKRTTIENNGRAGEKKSRAATETKVISELTDKSESNLRGESENNIKVKTEQKAKSVNVDRKGGGVFWLWFFIAVIVFLLLVAWFRRRKK